MSMRVERAGVVVFRRQSGTTSVEFALTAMLLFTIMFGITEFGRFLYVWNQAAETTRFGARLAVVCSTTDSANIKTQMIQRLPILSNSNITISYDPPTCTAMNCRSVTVNLSGASVTSVTSIVPFSLPVPAFSTTLPRESMSSTGNADCT